MTFRPLLAGSAATVLTLGLANSPAGAENLPAYEEAAATRQVTVAGHICTIDFGVSHSHATDSEPDYLTAYTNAFGDSTCTADLLVTIAYKVGTLDITKTATVKDQRGVVNVSDQIIGEVSDVHSHHRVYFRACDCAFTQDFSFTSK